MLDCRCGTVVPMLDTWLLRANGFVAVFCSEMCARKAAPKPPVVEPHRTMMARLYPAAPTKGPGK